MRYTQINEWDEYKETFLSRFKKDESYIICGAGEGFRTLLELFPELNICDCLDERPKQIAEDTIQVHTYDVLSEKDVRRQKFIITAGSEYYAEIRHTLLDYGIQEDQICSLQEILFFWGTHYHQKLYSTGCNIFLMTNCNLNCKGCSQFTPYIKKHRYNTLESVKQNIDQYFSLFHYVKDLILVGGETMLYRELGDVCAYIAERYSQRYHELKIFTNGLIIPKEDVIQKISNAPRVHVYISDYTCSITAESNVLINYLTQYNIQYTLNNHFGRSDEEYLWFDFGDPNICKNEDSDTLTRKFRKCSLVCQNVVDSKIYYCVPACAAVMGLINPQKDRSMYLDCAEMQRMESSKRMDVVGKFNLGFIDRGYLEFCRFCNGYGSDVNTHFIKAGEQC